MSLNIRDLKINATDFGNGERVPDRHSANGGNVIPELQISGVPEEAVELAVIMHDPDAPLPNGFTHWVAYGIAPSTRRLGGDQRSYRQGPNSIGQYSYTGPQPPPGHGTHHYYFWVYALSTTVKGEPTREDFLATDPASIIEQNRVVGTFSA